MAFFGAGFLLGRTCNKTCKNVPQQTASSFRVVLECPEAEFGVIMGGHPSVQGLLIIDVSESTAVREWNKKNPEHPIEVGQAVLEVNGISQPSTAMLQVFRDTKTVELVLTRELCPKQRALLRSSLELYRRTAIVEELLKEHVAEEPCSCCICHEENTEEEAQLPCGHRFHRACVRKWLISGRLRCPLCNHSFEPTPSAES
eukprot:Skav214116  [mRNA]  locus=scaffold1185:403571:404359:- [translate_table: standard]